MPLAKIKHVDAIQIFDSRGNPTLEAIVSLDDGAVGRGLVPSGASTGQFEAVELRDCIPGQYRGKSVFKAIEHVKSELAAAVVGMDVTEQEAVDRRMIELDGTPDKSRLGANAILGVSMAVANAGAASSGQPLYEYLGKGSGTLIPLPEIQIIGGGAHANWRTDVQDFLLIAINAQSYDQALRVTHDVYHAAGKLMAERGSQMGLADEGGYWPDFESHDQAFAVLLQAIEQAGYEPGKDAAICLDIAASDLFHSGDYHFKLENRTFSSHAFCDLMIEWCERYPIVSIEDPLADTDTDGWRRFTQAVGHRVQVIGDDLFTTNLTRIEHGIEQNLANAVLIKLNQIGTVTETIAAIRRTQEAGWQPVVSARSGETEDAFISHLAVATNAGQLKVGSFARSERMVKWNELLRIQHSMGARATWQGWSHQSSAPC